MCGSAWGVFSSLAELYGVPDPLSPCWSELQQLLPVALETVVPLGTCRCYVSKAMQDGEEQRCDSTVCGDSPGLPVASFGWHRSDGGIQPFFLVLPQGLLVRSCLAGFAFAHQTLRRVRN